MPRPISCEDYIDEIYEMAGWDRSKTYKALAEITETPVGLVLMFDLAEGFDVPKQKVEVTDPVTGETRKKQVKHYPDKYQNGGGLSFNEYQASRQNRIFDTLEGFTGGETVIPTTKGKLNPEELMEQLKKKNTADLSDSVREALERFGVTSDSAQGEQPGSEGGDPVDQDQYVGVEQLEMRIGANGLYVANSHIAGADPATIDLPDSSIKNGSDGRIDSDDRIDSSGKIDSDGRIDKAGNGKSASATADSSAIEDEKVSDNHRDERVRNE